MGDWMLDQLGFAPAPGRHLVRLGGTRANLRGVSRMRMFDELPRIVSVFLARLNATLRLYWSSISSRGDELMNLTVRLLIHHCSCSQDSSIDENQTSLSEGPPWR